MIIYNIYNIHAVDVLDLFKVHEVVPAVTVGVLLRADKEGSVGVAEHEASI